MLRGFIIAHEAGVVFEGVGSDTGFEVSLVMREGFEPLPGRHDLVTRIGFSDLSLGVYFVHREVTRAMEVEIGIECFGH